MQFGVPKESQLKRNKNHWNQDGKTKNVPGMRAPATSRPATACEQLQACIGHEKEDVTIRELTPPHLLLANEDDSQTVNWPALGNRSIFDFDYDYEEEDRENRRKPLKRLKR